MTGEVTTRRRRAGSMELLLVALIGLALSGPFVTRLLGDHDRVAAAATVFCGVFVQALPFLVLGVIVSGLVAAYVTPERLERWLPRQPALAVAVAGIGGAALPGCECGSVPVARRLFSGATAGAAL
ncbi:MAG: permease, partial [Mycobacterium sp.]